MRFVIKVILGKGNKNWLPPHFEKTLPKVNDAFRSEGRGVNLTDNMVRVTVFATRNEWQRMLSAVQGKRRKTVRAKRPAQQEKAKIKPTVGVCGICSGRHILTSKGCCRGCVASA